MTATINNRIVLASRPEGAPQPDNFAAEAVPVPNPGEGEILCRTIYLSLDPYMRGRMSTAKSYASPVEIGGVMVGGTVSEVVKSNNPRHAVGDIVVGYGGWQEYWLSDGVGLRTVDPSMAPISTAVGVLGMPGMTAYTGLLNIGQPKPGETVVVAAASGAVGAVVGQIAKLKGCRAVGIAGSEDKCRYVVDELGFDACVSHRSADLGKELKAACPNGIDVYFENVGGKVLETVLGQLNPFARMPVCGLIANYNLTGLPEGPDKLPIIMRQVLTLRLTLRGFIVWDYADQEPEFLREVSTWIREGKVKYREDMVEGIANAPEAFIRMLGGGNFGKTLVKVGADPTA
ncbi:MAG: NADP-dependent oxidoreductase [Rhodospirillales bacterium]|nr:NADP-dependent oxidoreductase [Rhodospirillales bacterium]MCW9040456.1 NADP-dependent oxidoreductase [Rhodospirillales bacterium]